MKYVIRTVAEVSVCIIFVIHFGSRGIWKHVYNYRAIIKYLHYFYMICNDKNRNYDTMSGYRHFIVFSDAKAMITTAPSQW